MHATSIGVLFAEIIGAMSFLVVNSLLPPDVAENKQMGGIIHH